MQRRLATLAGLALLGLGTAARAQEVPASVPPLRTYASTVVAAAASNVVGSTALQYFPLVSLEYEHVGTFGASGPALLDRVGLLLSAGLTLSLVSASFPPFGFPAREMFAVVGANFYPLVGVGLFVGPRIGLVFTSYASQFLSLGAQAGYKWVLGPGITLCLATGGETRIGERLLFGLNLALALGWSF